MYLPRMAHSCSFRRCPEDDADQVLGPELADNDGLLTNRRLLWRHAADLLPKHRRQALLKRLDMASPDEGPTPDN